MNSKEFMPPSNAKLLNKLTESKIKQLKPREKEYKVADGGGLYLKVMPNGSTYWRLKYRFGSANKEKTLAFGVYPVVSLKQARDRRNDAKKHLDQGIDPQYAKTQKKQQHLGQNLFKSVAYDWVEKRKGAWTDRHAMKVFQSLEKDVFPTLGDRPISEITPNELLDCVQAVSSRGARDTAKRILQRCTSVFQHGIITQHCSDNPGIGLQSAIPTPRKSHFKCIPIKEFPTLLNDIEHYQGETDVTRLGMKLMMLTFVRTAELRGAKWDEFDIESEEPKWTIPASRMKKKRQHIVPLSKQALEVLEKLTFYKDEHDWLVPSSRKPEQPISENTFISALIRMGYRGRMTVHGFRTLASTTLNEKGFDAEVIEKQLSHEDQNEVRSAYNRAEYMPKRIEMMQFWANHIDNLSQNT